MAKIRQIGGPKRIVLKKSILELVLELIIGHLNRAEKASGP